MRLFDTDRWNEIWQTISRNRKRSIMTALGVFWGIFMLIVLLGAGMGLRQMYGSQLGEAATNTVLMQAAQTSVPYRGMPVNRFWQMDNDDVETIRRLDEVRYAAGVFWAASHAHCSVENRKGEYMLMGYSPDFQKINPEKILFGRFVNDVDMLHKRKVCIIGTQVWKDLFPGGEDPTGKVIRIGSSYFTVVGVMKRQSFMMTFSNVERTVVIPISLAQQMFRQGKHIHMLAVAGYDDVPSPQVEAACKKELFARYIISPDDKKAVWVMLTYEFFTKIQNLLRGISLLTWIVGLGTLFAGIIGISNIMLVLVKERTQEIGIRRALGASPATILSQILSESFVLTFIAGVLGLAAAVGVLSAADKIYYEAVVVAKDGVNISWQISFGTGMLALLILVTGSLIAGIIPAIRALSIKAVDAIREE